MTRRWPAWKHAALRPRYRNCYVKMAVRATPLRPLCTRDFIRLLTTDEGKKMADCKRSNVMLELDTGTSMRRTVICVLEHPRDTRLVGGWGKEFKLESVLGPWFTPAGADVLRRRAKEQERAARRQFEAQDEQLAGVDRSRLHAQHLAVAPPTEIERRWLAEGYQVSRVKLPGAMGTLSVAHDGEAAAHSAEYKTEPSRAERIDQLRDEIARDIASDRERTLAAQQQTEEARLDATLDAAYDKRSAELAPCTEPLRAPAGFVIDAIELDGLGSILRVILRPA